MVSWPFTHKTKLWSPSIRRGNIQYCNEPTILNWILNIGVQHYGGYLVLDSISKINVLQMLPFSGLHMYPESWWGERHALSISDKQIRVETYVYVGTEQRKLWFSSFKSYLGLVFEVFQTPASCYWTVWLRTNICYINCFPDLHFLKLKLTSRKCWHAIFRGSN